MIVSRFPGLRGQQAIIRDALAETVAEVEAERDRLRDALTEGTDRINAAVDELIAQREAAEAARKETK